MKKVGIRLLLSLILVTMLVVAGTAPVSAKGKPVKLGITITCITEGSITVDYWWNKIGARYYAIGVYNSDNDALNVTGQIDLLGRTPKQSGRLTLTSPEITCGQQYRAILWLYRKPNVQIHGAKAQDYETFSCPSPTQIFGECFCGMPEGPLPAGWVTNNSSIVYVYPFSNAGGSPSELLLWYGWPENETQDYWARTPTIDATATTTALNLTFKHGLWIFEWGNNFTYSVEVSIDGGSTWTAVLEETPTEAQYPGMVIGPETKNIDLSAFLGNSILIRWRLTGYTYYSDGWFIDDIIVDGY